MNEAAATSGYEQRIRELEAENERLRQDSDWVERAPPGLDAPALRILWDDSRAENRKLKAELERMRAVVTCAADDLAARSILENGAAAGALAAILEAKEHVR